MQKYDGVKLSVGILRELLPNPTYFSNNGDLGGRLERPY